MTDPRAIKKWKVWETVLRVDLMTIAERCDDAAMQMAIMDLIQHWDCCKRGSEIVDGRERVVVGATGNPRSTGSLLCNIIRRLIWAFITQNLDHRVHLQHIIHDNRLTPIRRWSMIQLIDEHGEECWGFRNVRVAGGEGADYRYYYFPKEYVRVYGLDAARKQRER